MLPGLIGVVQATETVKLLLGRGEPLIGRLLTYDALGMHFREVRIRRDPKCPLCGERPTIRDLSLHAAGGAAACPLPGAPATGSTAGPAPQRGAGGAGATGSSG